MLEGAIDGLWVYITPRWETLLQAGPWMDGASQIFFAYSSGTGALQALGSYNKFNHNCYKYVGYIQGVDLSFSRNKRFPL